MPTQVSYAASNAVYFQQSKWLNGLAGLAEPIDPETAIEWLTPRCERFERPDPQYPLLKRTTGFHGAKQFDIAIEKKVISTIVATSRI